MSQNTSPHRDQSLPEPKRLGLIWAQGSNRAIGRDGTMPWHIPEDLRWFQERTRGYPVIMGRTTWESLPEKFRPLPHRQNIVLTRSANLALDGAQVVGDFQQALDACSGQPAWVMGGGEVYKMALPYADLVARTQIALDVPDADTFAPELDQRWEQVWISDSRRSQNGTPYTFELWSQKS